MDMAVSCRGVAKLHRGDKLMSNSLLYHAWGLRGYHYVGTDYAAAVIRFAVEQDPATFRCAQPRLKHLRHVAVDEIHVGSRRGYLTVVLDLDSGAVVFVGKGKGAEALPPFWRRLRGSGARVRAVATDMSAAYTAAVRENL